MKRKLSLLLVVTLLCTLFVTPVSAAEAASYTGDQAVVTATSGSNYFSKITPKLNSLNGSSAMATLSSGSCSGNERSITSVSVNCRVSSGSSRYTLYVISPDGTTLSKSCRTSSTTYTFTGFNGEDPKGDWIIIIISDGVCENKYSYDYSEVMDSVFSVIRQHMSLCVEKTKFVQKMNSRKENVLQYDIYTKQIAKLQNDVRRITANKSGLYEDYREQLITAEELCQYQREYESRVNEIEAQITELLHRRSLYEKEFHIDEGWEETVNKYMTKRKLTKELVDAFVSEIVFYDGNIEVKLLYDDFLKELLKVAEEREVSSNG